MPGNTTIDAYSNWQGSFLSVSVSQGLSACAIFRPGPTFSGQGYSIKRIASRPEGSCFAFSSGLHDAVCPGMYASALKAATSWFKTLAGY